MQGAPDGAGGGPHLALLPVEGQVQGAAVADDDLLAVVEGFAGGGGDEVVGADAEAFGGEQFADVVGEGVEGARDAVHGEPYGLVGGDERRGAAREEGDDEGLRHDPPPVPAEGLDGCAAAPGTAAARDRGGRGGGGGHGHGGQGHGGRGPATARAGREGRRGQGVGLR